MVSKDNKQAAFVKNQELYLYDNDSAQVGKVFSFLQEDKANVRDSYDQHGIKIMRIDEKGNLAFLVYGYMNRDGMRDRMEFYSTNIMRRKTRSRRLLLFHLNSHLPH